MLMIVGEPNATVADIVTTGITTTVVMVVAAMNPETAWQQPMLRLVDSVFGIALGVVCKRTLVGERQ